MPKRVRARSVRPRFEGYSPIGVTLDEMDRLIPCESVAGKVVSAPRCYVIAQSYLHFTRFCTKHGIDPKDKDVICVIPDHDWMRLFRGVTHESSYFVFLAGWDEMINIAGTERRNEILGRINSITMTQNPPYKREA